MTRRQFDLVTAALAVLLVIGIAAGATLEIREGDALGAFLYGVVLGPLAGVAYRDVRRARGARS